VRRKVLGLPETVEEALIDELGRHLSHHLASL
jgi:hypothetical protein